MCYSYEEIKENCNIVENNVAFLADNVINILKDVLQEK